MIPTADMDVGKDPTDITSSIRYKQGTTGVQNNIVVEIEESNQTGAVSLDPNAADGIFQSFCISFPSLIFVPSLYAYADLKAYYASLGGIDGASGNMAAPEEQVVIGYIFMIAGF